MGADAAALSLRLHRAARLARTGLRVGRAKLTGGRVPVSVTFSVTHRCNLRCRYCDFPQTAGAELTTGELRRAIDELAAAGMVRAGFSGGEALLRPDTVELIAHAHARGLVTTLTTNGWNTAEKLDALAPVLDLLAVSLDGPEAEHDAARRSGSHRRAMETLEGARARGMTVSTITVLSARHADVIEYVLGVAERLGITAYFQPAHAGCFDVVAGLEPGLDRAALESMAGKLREARAGGRPVGGSPGFFERLAAFPSGPGCAGCSAGRYWGMVLPDGALVPCTLVSRSCRSPDGRAVGFAEAFRRIPRPDGGMGCAITPYQELDLMFGLDPRAWLAAARRVG